MPGAVDYIDNPSTTKLKPLPIPAFFKALVPVQLHGDHEIPGTKSQAVDISLSLKMLNSARLATEISEFHSLPEPHLFVEGLN